jgi:IS30 family transposase
MGYTHLTAGERYQIEALLGKQCSLREIASRLGRDKGTISREIRRNRGQRGYRPQQAATFAMDRRQHACNARQIDPEVWLRVEAMLRLELSPVQISGRLKRKKLGKVSHETIYRRVYADKATGGDLHVHLRCQKKRRKRYGSGRSRRGRIPNRVGIEERCPRVEARATVGHWEGDTVMGKNHKGALVTHVERKSRYTCIRHVARKTASEVAEATKCALGPYAALVKTITNDNGLEFAAHGVVSKSLDAKIYFAQPYSSWQRGTNENTNGLIRQYLPKKTSFKNIPDALITFIQDRLNHRPRKCLDFQTPYEVLIASARSRGVALQI